MKLLVQVPEQYGQSSFPIVCSAKNRDFFGAFADREFRCSTKEIGWRTAVPLVDQISVQRGNLGGCGHVSVSR